MSNIPEMRAQLQEAASAGVLVPDRRAWLYYSYYTNTARFVLWCLREADGNGLSTTQAVHRTRLSLNTTKCYLRELRALKLVRSIRGKENIWYLADKY